MLTVDASVWIAAGDASDIYAERSRSFLAAVGRRQESLVVPSFTEVEIACALARRRQSAEAGLQWARAVMALPSISRVPLDTILISHSLQLGPQFLLRSADALYAAVAALYSAPLVTWDAELIRRAGAITPTNWLAANAA